MEVQIGERKRRPEVQPSRSNRVTRASIDQYSSSYDRRALVPQCFDRF